MILFGFSCFTEIIISFWCSFLPWAPQLHFMFQIIFLICVNHFIKLWEDISAMLVNFEELCASEDSVHLLWWPWVHLEIVHSVTDIILGDRFSVIFFHVYYEILDKDGITDRVFDENLVTACWGIACIDIHIFINWWIIYTRWLWIIEQTKINSMIRSKWFPYHFSPIGGFNVI